MVSGQVALSDTSPTKLTVTGPQLSEAVTRLISEAGTSPAHSTVTVAGQVILGGVVSSTTIACVQSVVLLQRSVAR